MAGRFSAPVRPGDALVVEVWLLGAGEAAFRVATGSGQVVIDHGRLGYLDIEPEVTTEGKDPKAKDPKGKGPEGEGPELMVEEP